MSCVLIRAGSKFVTCSICAIRRVSAGPGVWAAAGPAQEREGEDRGTTAPATER